MSASLNIVREPGDPTIPVPSDAVDRVRAAASQALAARGGERHRRLMDELEIERRRLAQPTKRTAKLQRALQDASGILSVLRTHRASLETMRRQAVRDRPRENDGSVLLQIGDIERYLESFGLRRTQLELEQPQITECETALLAELRRQLLSLASDRAASDKRILDLYPAVETFVAEVREQARIRDGINAVAKKATAAEIAFGELKVDDAPGFRTSANSKQVDGSLIMGLRVPGVAPAGAGEAPPWLYKPPE